MKKQVIVFIVISVLALISCTGCDGEVGGAVDLSYNTDILTSYQWVKELIKDDIEYISFNATPMDDTHFILTIFDNEELEGDSNMGMVDMSDESGIIVTIDSIKYEMRITSSSEGVITLSLKNQEDDEVMYFAATPLEI